MTVRTLSFIALAALSSILFSCSSGKQISTTVEKKEAPKAVPQGFRYLFYFQSLGSTVKQHDEIWIDSNGQVTFHTEQHMKDGSWKSPQGLAYLEPRDEDSLLSFIKEDALFSIDEADVTPQCAEGDIYTFKIYRTDLKKMIIFKTNPCAAEFNLLTGKQRKIFPLFVEYINRLRDRYRPLYTE